MEGIRDSLLAHFRIALSMVEVFTTCWVIDHPAHAQALLPFIKEGSTHDLIIATKRPDVEHLLATSEGVMPRREMLWVERPVGNGVGKIARLSRARRRFITVRQALKARRAGTRHGEQESAHKSGGQIDQIVVIAAPLELRAAKRAGIPRRLYISDNEGDHFSHRLALGASTEILLPDSWRGDLDGGFLAKAERKGLGIHRFSGNKAHVYLRPVTLVEQREPPVGGAASEASEAGEAGAAGTAGTAGAAGEGMAAEAGKRIMVRRLLGGGIHDGEMVEMIELEKLGLDCEIDEHIEGEKLPEPWSLPNHTLNYDGVLTQSVTLATESASLGVATLLISSAERGVFGELLASGVLNICDKVENQIAEITAWLSDPQQTDCGEWPDTLAQWNSFIQPTSSETKV